MLEGAEHCDNQEELQKYLDSFPKIEGEHEEGYKLTKKE